MARSGRANFGPFSPSVRARWSRRAFLRALDARRVRPRAMLLVGLLAVWLIAQEGIPLVFVVAAVGLIAGVALSFALLPLRQPPVRSPDRALHRRAGRRPRRSGRHRGRQARDADRGRSSTCWSAMPFARRARSIRIASSADDTLSRAAIGAAVGSVGVCSSRSGSSRRRPSARSTSPARTCSRSYYAIEVTPGSIKVREGQPRHGRRRAFPASTAGWCR